MADSSWHLLRRVADGETVRAIIGHATAQMTHHYSHVDEADKHAAISRAFEVVTGGQGTERVVERVVGGGSSSERIETQNKKPAVSGGLSGGATQI